MAKCRIGRFVEAQVLAQVAARQGNQLVTAFHPELSEDLSVHKYFLDML